MGVYIQNTHNAVVQGNLIGLDGAGTGVLGNATGVWLSNAANNLIGGTTAATRNIISGNGNGVVVFGGATTTGNLVQGNFIGTDVSGSAALGNVFGAAIQNAFGNTIGGTVSGAGNLISGNATGVELVGAADGNFVQGNTIGLDATGTAVLGNSDGVVIHNPYVGGSPTNNIIGGTAPGARNIISGNVDGIVISDAGTTGNQVVGNYIGTNAAGTAVIGTGTWGVLISTNAANNTIGGTAGAGNVISGFSQGGIAMGIGATGNVAQGNLIGLNAAGNAVLGNTVGVVIQQSAALNIIGGTTVGVGNVISGSSQDGIRINDAGSTGNQVQGNFIGTDASGSAALGNLGNGVHVIDSPGNTIGGSVAGAGNVISSNHGEGIRVDGASATGNVIEQNFVGTNASQALLGNLLSGIYLRRAPGNSVIGNTIVNSQGFAGVAICGNVNGGCGGGNAGTQSSNGDGNMVQNNFINNNAGYGVSLDGVANTQVGTSGGNNISSNGINGITIFGAGATGNQIQANAINGNTGDGVNITGNGNTGNRIQSNSFINNTQLGIDLVAAADVAPGATANDSGDGDTGPNNLQNFPLIGSADTASVQGTLNSTSNTTFSVQLYESTAACGVSGQGEGLLETFNVTTDGSGNAPFTRTGLVLIAGRYVMATATDPAGNTSEFSGCVQIVAAAVPNPQLEFVGAQPSGDFVQYNLSVSNRDAYPDSMFAAAPNLPPCGLNTNSSRTWVDIFANGSRVYGFCALESSAGLQNLWFAWPGNQPPPTGVSITLTDRLTNSVYTSNTISVLPAPIQLSPADGSVFNIYPRTTTLTWAPVPGAVSYVLEREFCSPLGCSDWSVAYPVVTGLTTTSFTFDFVGAQPGRWRVRAVDGAGGQGVVSPWWNFHYTI